MIKTIYYFRFIIFILMLTTFIPVVFYRFPSYIGSYHLWAIIWGISLLLLKPRVLITKIMIIVEIYTLLLLFMIYFFWQNMNQWNVEFLLNEIYNIVIACSIITYFNVTNDYKGLAKITKYVLFFLLITAIMTIVASYIYPMYARYSTYDGIEGQYARGIIRSYGAGDYGLAIVYMALIPLLIYYIKNNLYIKNKKWMFFIIIFLYTIALIRMQIFTNIIILCIFLIFAFISTKNRIRTISIIIFIIILFFSIPNRYYINAFYRLSDSFINLEDTSFKLKEAAIYFESGGNVEKDENAVAGRAERYNMLLKVFPKNPILGCFFLSNIDENGYKVESFHLYWMNKLIITGLFLFILFILILYNFIIEEKKMIKGEYKYFIMLAFFSIIIYGFFKNLAGRECWFAFFIIIPGIYYLPLLNKNQEENI